MRFPRLLPSVLIVLVLLASAPARAESPYNIAWVRQFGTSSAEWSTAVSGDGLGQVYVTGYSNGPLGGPNAGEENIFLSKFDTAGNLLWHRQLSSDSEEAAYAVAADALGNVFISGYTFGLLNGAEAGAGGDFIGKYDAAGNLQWVRQFGNRSDECYGLSPDGLGNVYVSGRTFADLGTTNAGEFDAFVCKYDSAGSQLWARQLGTATKERAYGVSADRLGNVFISGYTMGTLDGPTGVPPDAFVSKYDPAGNLQWVRQLAPTSGESSRAVSADGTGNVYFGGDTFGSLDGPNAGGADAFVGKYDAVGNLLWVRQLGSSAEDIGRSVAADAAGNVFISGYTAGSLAEPNAGGRDFFVSKYDAAGNLLWTRQFGTAADDDCFGLFADGLGDVYLTGHTRGSLGGPNAGNYDAFLIKLSVPEPGSLAILTLCGMGLFRRRGV